MKKLLTGLCVFLPVLALAASKNTVSMVTFFPVPYVSYSNVSVERQLDVGLTNQACEMSLGSPTLSTTPLTVQKNTNVNSGSLFFESNGRLSISGNTSLGVGGSASTVSPADLIFHQGLRTHDVYNAGSINSPEMHVGGLTLFGRTFPACDNNGDHTISWQELALGPDPDNLELYLVCGPAPVQCKVADRVAAEEASKTACDSNDTPSKYCDPDGSCSSIAGTVGVGTGTWTGTGTGTGTGTSVGGTGTSVVTPATGSYVIAFWVGQGADSVCGQKKQNFICSNPPTWTATDWNTDGCFYYSPTAKKNISCGTLCNSTDITGTAVTTVTQSCSNGSVSRTGQSYDVSACQKEFLVPSCWNGSQTQNVSYSNGNCSLGPLVTIGTGYKWVKTGTAKKSIGSGSDSCNCTNANCNHAACGKNFSQDWCVASREGEKKYTDATKCTFDMKKYRYYCSLTEYTCTAFNNYSDVVDSGGQCIHHAD